MAPGEPLRRAEEEKPINPLLGSSSCGERTRRGEETAASEFRVTPQARSLCGRPPPGFGNP